MTQKLLLLFFVGGSVFLAQDTAFALATSPAAQLSHWSTTAGAPGDTARGRQFFTSAHGRDISCASCHGSSPTSPGKHSSTGKVLEPLAPSANPKVLTDTQKIDKWFKRNCNDVLRRECSAQEKADVIAFLISLKP